MTCRNTHTRICAVTLVVALHLIYLPAPTAGDEAGITGNILRAEGQSPVAGAVVHATDPVTETSFASVPTKSDGSFELNGMPASSYVLAVEVDGGLYVVEVPVKLVPGQSRSVQLAVNPNLAPAAGGLKTTIKNNPLTATLIIIGGATALGLLIDEIDDDDEIVSPVSPG
jgi:hypothetical protein